jgi:hypothetical protein
MARQHTLGRLQFAELPSQVLPLRIDPRERLADPLLLPVRPVTAAFPFNVKSSIARS